MEMGVCPPLSGTGQMGQQAHPRGQQVTRYQLTGKNLLVAHAVRMLAAAESPCQVFSVIPESQSSEHRAGFEKWATHEIFITVNT